MPSFLWCPPAWRLRTQPEFRAAQQPLAPIFAPKTVRRNYACREVLSSCRSLGLRGVNTLTAHWSLTRLTTRSETLFFPFPIFFYFHFDYISASLVRPLQNDDIDNWRTKDEDDFVRTERAWLLCHYVTLLYAFYVPLMNFMWKRNW